MDAKKLGQFIAQLRKEQNMTQADLAAKLQVTDKAVSKWERGVGLPDINSVEPLAEALGVTVLEIMRSERISEESVASVSVSEVITGAFDMVNEQRKQERKSVLYIAMVVLSVITSVFLADTIGWMGVAFVALPSLCFVLAICLFVYGIIRHRNKQSCNQTFIWGVILISLPVVLAISLFLIGAFGIGPVPS